MRNQQNEGYSATFRQYQGQVWNNAQLPSARLNFEHVKPADRATYLLNYLYMRIQACQLLVDNWQRGEGSERLNTLKECFLRCLRPYM